MTLQQKAYEMINELSDDSVQVIIEVMSRMMPYQASKSGMAAHVDQDVSLKMKAYLRMQELRKETAKYDISAEQRNAALDEKYGVLK